MITLRSSQTNLRNLSAATVRKLSKLCHILTRRGCQHSKPLEPKGGVHSVVYFGPNEGSRLAFPVRGSSKKVVPCAIETFVFRFD